MAVPKRRQSRSRRDMRRSQWARIHGKPPNLTRCPNCTAPVRSHRVCLECGQYNGTQVTEARTTETTGE